MRKEYILKTIIAGQTGAGKTCFAHRLVNNFFMSEYKPGTDVEYMLTSPFDINGDTARLQIWNVPGNTRLDCWAKSYFNDAYAAIIIIDPTQKNAVAHTKTWINSINQTLAYKLPILLIQTKTGDKRHPHQPADDYHLTYENFRESFPEDEFSNLIDFHIISASNTSAEHITNILKKELIPQALQLYKKMANNLTDETVILKPSTLKPTPVQQTLIKQTERNSPKKSGLNVPSKKFMEFYVQLKKNNPELKDNDTDQNLKALALFKIDNFIKKIKSNMRIRHSAETIDERPMSKILAMTLALHHLASDLGAHDYIATEVCLKNSLIRSYPNQPFEATRLMCSYGTLYDSFNEGPIHKILQECKIKVNGILPNDVDENMRKFYAAHRQLSHIQEDMIPSRLTEIIEIVKIRLRNIIFNENNTLVAQGDAGYYTLKQLRNELFHDPISIVLSNNNIDFDLIFPKEKIHNELSTLFKYEHAVLSEDPESSKFTGKDEESFSEDTSDESSSASYDL